MAEKKEIQHISEEGIANRIHMFRGKQVIFDSDLAEFYAVETSNLNKAVKRNLDRFPDDFMFQLTKDEWESLIFQSGISKPQGRGGRRTPPFAFTEQGVAMLSSVLRSKTAIQVNIQIIRAFTRMRHLITNYEQLWHQLEQLETEQIKQNTSISQIFEALKQLLIQEEKPKRQLGFRSDEDS